MRKSLNKEIEKPEEIITDQVKEEIGPECPSYHHTGMVLLEIILPSKQLVRFRTS